MKSLSSALLAAIGGAVQQPAFLIEVGFSAVSRWSTFSTITWNSQTWTQHPVIVDGLEVSALQVDGSLVIDNRDGVAGAQVLNENPQDKTIKIWGYDAAATASGDIVALSLESVGASCEVTATQVRIGLRHKTAFVQAPRAFIRPDVFGPMLPAGAVIRINGIDYKVER